MLNKISSCFIATFIFWEMVVVLVYLVEDWLFHPLCVVRGCFQERRNHKTSGSFFGAITLKHTAAMSVEVRSEDCNFGNLQMCFIKFKHLRRNSGLVIGHEARNEPTYHEGYLFIAQVN